MTDLMIDYEETFLDESDARRAGFTLNEDQAFDRLVVLNRQLNVTKADIKQLLSDIKFHKDDNPKGIPGDEVKKIAASAVRFAAADYEEKKLAALELFAKYEQLTDYNE
jgi:hypothetical protein